MSELYFMTEKSPTSYRYTQIYSAVNQVTEIRIIPY